MGDKKHIDRLFQEKLKDFDATPSDSVWHSIEKELHQKKRKRRIIPLWWQSAGVAAVLALLFSIRFLIINDAPEKNPITNSVVNTESKDSLDTNSEINSTSNDDQKINVAENDTSEETLNSDPKSDNIINKPSNVNTTVANTDNNPKSIKSGTLANNPSNISKNSDAIASNINNDKTLNTSNLPEQNQTEQNSIKPKNEILEDAGVVDSKVSVAENQNNDELLELNKENPIKESLSLEDAIADVEETAEKEEEKLNRWNISTNVAPVYFNTLGKGSSLDAQFVDNSKSGEINMSYGINGSYAINKKLKIRAGINKVDLGYSTNNVIVYKGTGIASVSSVSRSKSNIKYNANSENTTILSAQNLSFAMVPNAVAINTNSSLNQELGFIELPVEVEYVLLSKKLGINVIGGFSTLFLDKNNVYSVLNGEKSLLGEAVNINDTSYSANFGLGLNYNFSDKIKFNLEPTFKYQINTFRNTSGSFQPYFIGVYTGLSYKF